MDTRAFVVFKEIKEWEVEHGESFIDHYGYNIEAPDFMEWALEKKLITDAQFDGWQDAYPSLEADDPNYYIMTDDKDVTWALIIDVERTEESEDKGLIYLANFIAERDDLLEEFREFIDGEDEGY